MPESATGVADRIRPATAVLHVAIRAVFECWCFPVFYLNKNSLQLAYTCQFSTAVGRYLCCGSGNTNQVASCLNGQQALLSFSGLPQVLCDYPLSSIPSLFHSSRATYSWARTRVHQAMTVCNRQCRRRPSAVSVRTTNYRRTLRHRHDAPHPIVHRTWRRAPYARVSPGNCVRRVSVLAIGLEPPFHIQPTIET